MKILKIKKLNNLVIKINNNFFEKLGSLFAPLLLFAMRLWIANIFFKSGKSKIANMDTTIFLFTHKYSLPYIPPVFAAYLGTFFELICPILIVFGFLTRVAILPLLFMTIIIQSLVYHYDHYHWLFLMATILIYGGGKLSADNFFKIK